MDMWQIANKEMMDNEWSQVRTINREACNSCGEHGHFACCECPNGGCKQKGKAARALSKASAWFAVSSATPRGSGECKVKDGGLGKGYDINSKGRSLQDQVEGRLRQGRWCEMGHHVRLRMSRGPSTRMRSGFMMSGRRW
jgi:hypothetical protein